MLAHKIVEIPDIDVSLPFLVDQAEQVLQVRVARLKQRSLEAGERLSAIDLLFEDSNQRVLNIFVETACC